MALVSSSLDNLLNGVSQQPPRLRLPSQSAAETNTLAVRGEGLLKRPPTEHVAALDTSSPPADAFVHVVSYSEDERYVIVLTPGDIQVFDAEDGTELTVLFPEGIDYFAAPAATISLTDTFEGPDPSQETLLSAHVPTGDADSYTWAVGTYTSPLSDLRVDEVTNEGYVGNAPTSGSYPVPCVGVASLSPSSADYTVALDVTIDYYNPDPGNRTHIIGVTARGAANGGLCYRAYVNTAAGGTLTLDRIDAAGAVVVADSEAYTWVDEVEYTLALRCTGTLIEALVNDVVVLSMTDGTLTAAGKVGIMGNRSANLGGGFALFDNFQVTEAPVVDPTVPSVGTSTRALTIQDTTVLVNRGTEVTKGTGTSDIRPPEALIYIRQADYETTYSVVINGSTYSYATASTSRAAIATDFIAEELLGVLTDAGLSTEYTMAQYGSSIHITRIDEADFTIGTKDGLADAGLIVIKGKAQRFSDLPAVALDGFLVEITGDPGTEADNYWVQYNDADTADRQGIWVETLKPGRLTSLDATTLPHVLVRNGSVVPEFENGPTPKPPIVRPHGSGGVQKVGFEDHFWDIDSEPGAGNNSHELRDDDEEAYANLKFAAGLSTEFTFTYAVTTEDMAAANALTVTVRYNASQGSTSWTTAGSKRYEGNTHDYTDSIVFTAPIGANCDVNVLLTYDTPPIDSGFTDERGEVRIPSDNSTPAGLQFTAPTDVDVIFDADEIYPVGYTVTLDVDAASPTYTVATAPMTGAELATALEVEVEAVADISSAVADTATVRITRTTSGLPVVTIDTAEPAFATHCWQEDATLTVDALVGMTVENVTDGSVGVIGDNGTSYISTSALTGGSTNRFNPGDLIRVIDTDNLPYFVFRAADWSERIVGDDDSNPFPSFTGATIDEVFFTQGRLGFTSGANVVLSQADDLFNFFRSTVTALRDSDNIDLTSTGSLERFHGVVSWNEEVLLFAEKGQYRLDGGSGLSPRTASLPNVGKYESSPNVRPVVIGSSVFFPSQHGAYTWMSEMRVAQDGLRTIAQPITTEVPRYLLGGPLLLTGTAGVLVALTDDDRSTLFAYCYSDEPDGRVMGGWRTWQFAPGCSILGVDVLGPSTLVLVIKYSDGLYLETLDLSRREDGSLAFPVHLDRRVTPASRTLDVDEDEAVVTDFDLPYPVAVDGSEGTVGLTLQATGAPLTVTRPTTTTARVTGTYAASDVWAGLRYSFLYRLSTLFLRRQNVPINDGRLDLRWLTVVFTRTRSFLFRVTQLGRTDKTRQYSSTSLLTSFADESERYPVQGRTEDVVLSLEDSTSEPLCLTALDWEGNYTSRSQRV